MPTLEGLGQATAAQINKLKLYINEQIEKIKTAIEEYEALESLNSRNVQGRRLLNFEFGEYVINITRKESEQRKPRKDFENNLVMFENENAESMPFNKSSNAANVKERNQNIQSGLRNGSSTRRSRARPLQFHEFIKITTSKESLGETYPTKSEYNTTDKAEINEMKQSKLFNCTSPKDILKLNESSSINYTRIGIENNIKRRLAYARKMKIK